MATTPPINMTINVTTEQRHKLKDSGERQTFETGGMREPHGNRARPVLLSPMVIRRLAEHMAAGAEKYDERNWELGLPLSSYIDSAQRHLYDLQEGLTDEDHAIAMLWNIHGFIHTAIMIGRGLLPEELDDMPDYTGALVDLEDD